MSSELKLVITFHQYWPAGLKINIYTLSVLFPDLHGFSPLQSLPDMIASTQREHTNSTGNKRKFHYLLFNLWNLNWILTVLYSSPGHSGALCDGQQQQGPSSSEQPLNLPPPGPQTTDDKQTVRHVLLCLLLFVSLLAVRIKCVLALRKKPG